MDFASRDNLNSSGFLGAQCARVINRGICGITLLLHTPVVVSVTDVVLAWSNAKDTELPAIVSGPAVHRAEAPPAFQRHITFHRDLGVCHRFSIGVDDAPFGNATANQLEIDFAKGFSGSDPQCRALRHSRV